MGITKDTNRRLKTQPVFHSAGLFRGWAIVSVLSSLLWSGHLFAFDFDAAWNRVDQAVAQGHPNTAIRELTAIEKEAVSLHEWAQAIRCSAVRILVSLDLEKTKMEELLPVFSDFAAAAPEPMRPGIQLLVAHLYWTYYRENHWRFLHRSASAGDEDRDPAAWSRERILAEIESRFERVLEFETELRQVPIGTYAPLLQPGRLPDACRPTLYDFAVYDMLDFYRQTAYARHADTRWTLKPSGPCFSSADKFQQFVPESLSSESVLFRGIRLLQKLLRFHEEDTDRTAFADADLTRLQFCYEFGTGPRGARQYADALDQFMARNRAMESSARAAALRAELACSAGQDFGLAHLIASRAVARFPESVGGIACRKLIGRLETPSFSVLTEESWCEPWTELTVLYRNLTDVFFRLVPLTPQEVMELTSAEWARLQKPNSRSWTQPLPPASDYKERRFSVPIPKGIPPGLYALIASDDPTFEKNGTGISVKLIHAGNLAVVARTDQPSGFVLSATDGMPVAGATVQMWEVSQGVKKSWRAVSETVSDENGAFDLGSFQKEGRIVAWTADGRCAFASFEPLHKREKRKASSAGEQVSLFTDRAVYRPGEIVSFSGICYHLNPEKEQFHVISNRAVTVSLANPKGKGISLQKLTSDAYGVLYGSFQLPENAVGTFSLRTEKQSVPIPVAENTNERFAVRLNVDQNEIRLGDQVVVEGVAETDGRLPLADAQVAWRVIAGTCGTTPGRDQVIASGETVTDSHGHFPILFTAESDASGKSDENDVRLYRVIAEVMSRSGETQFATWSCRVAHASWESEVAVDEYTFSDRPVSFRVAVRQLNGGGVGTKGRLRIFSVRTPARVHRDPLLTDAERGIAPELAEEDAAVRDWEMWKEQDEIAAQQIATDTNGGAKGSVQLPTGMYRFSFETSDHAGKRVTAQKTFAVFDKTAERMAFPVPDFLAVEKRELLPGESLRFFWGSGYQDAHFYTALLKDGEKLFERFNTPGRSQESFEFPIDDTMRGELALVTCFVRENRIYTHRERISVPHVNRRLSLRWERFSSRLVPEEEVTWKIRVTDENGAPVAASVTAAMHERSFDSASPREWLRFQTSFVTDETKRVAESVRFSFGNGRSCLENTWKRERREEPEDADMPHYRQWRREIVPRWEDASFGGMKSRLLRTRLLKRGGTAKPESSGVPPLLFATPPHSRSSAPELSASPSPVREPLRQSVFFFPALQTDTNGVASITFPAPKALAAWHLRLVAHDSQLRYAELDDASIVTCRELSVQGIPSRFVREQDHLFFSARITNDSESAQRGTARLSIEAHGEEGNVCAETLLSPAAQKFHMNAQGTTQVEWHLQIPDGATGITYRVTAETDRFRDSEEGVFPVLPRQVTVRESFPLSAAGEEPCRYEFMSLVASVESPTLRHSGLTVQGVVSPVGYALHSLVALLDAPCESSDELFARAFAAAVLESEAKRSGTNLFSRADALRFARVREESMRGLAGVQVSGGLWPWFSGGEKNLDVSLNILSGLVQLQRLTGEKYPILRSALPRLDRTMRELAEARWRQGDLKPTVTEAMYLYIRASSLADVPMDAGQKRFWERLLAEVRETWKGMDLVSRTMVMLALHRAGDRELPPQILQSLSDAVRAQSCDWFASPCAAEARMLEAYLELAGEERVWKECLSRLLLHRGESGWGTARDTVEAAAAILRMAKRNDEDSFSLPKLKLGTRRVIWSNTERNGIAEEWIPASEVSSEMGNITFRGRDGETAPVMIHWSYRENSELIHKDGEPLFYLRKRLGIRDRGTGDLKPLQGVLEPGTEVVVCLDFAPVTSMRYVRLHDEFPGGVKCEERSRIRRQNGLVYEQRVHETYTEFSFENLPRGMFTIEYTCRADQCGQFHGGNAWIECATRPDTRVYNSNASTLPKLLIDRKQ